jgi:hypothetical protein
MLQSQKNKQTLEILRKLRQQGAPEPTTVSLDMTLGKPEEEDGEDEEGAEPDFDENEEQARAPGGAGTLADIEFPSEQLTPTRGKKKARKRGL